jgi:hypothetical protein
MPAIDKNVASFRLKRYLALGDRSPLKKAYVGIKHLLLSVKLRPSDGKLNTGVSLELRQLNFI